MSARVLRLKKTLTTTVRPKPPYRFDQSVFNPSYYPTPTNVWQPGSFWFTIRWKSRPLGIRLKNKGTFRRPAVSVAVYGKPALMKENADILLDELDYRFEWHQDYAELYRLARSDSLLGRSVQHLKGMRAFCAENLYELLMITILLQNARVRRTETMTKAMLGTYGDLLEFDGERLYCFWDPQRLLAASEEELRGLKVGYRAKLFLRATQEYVGLDEERLRAQDGDVLRRTLLGIYGVGPATVDYLMSGAFHRKAALNTVPPWEAKIFSRIMFGRPGVGPERILDELRRRYGAWRGLAAHYLFMELCWRHRKKPVDWFAKLMPY